MSPRVPVERLVSSGGVVYRRTDGELEVVICGRGVPTYWGLPKGTPNPQESLEETARREVAEETGLDVTIDGKVGSIDYWFYPPQATVRCHKTVHFYLMTPVGGDLSRHDPEFDVVQWLPLEEALHTLAYPNEVEVLRKAASMVAHSDDPSG